MANSIVRASIHPAIGIARVGSSIGDYILAPQVSDPQPRHLSSSHDGEGNLKREAAQFRVYGCDEHGAVVAELTTDNAEITWTVHIANTKAAWYKFRHAMDIPTVADTIVERRNPTIVDPVQRSKLAIEPGSRSISGRDQGGKAEHRFDTGMFGTLTVDLGEIRTDHSGRLIFLGGRGVSESPGGAPPYVDTDQDAFGNAADWYDDVSDGPVDAVVRVNGIEIPTEGAWVVTAPPNYAPDQKAWRTLYDALVDVYVAAGWMTPKTDISFTNDIYPILSRLSSLQWVNKTYAAVFGVNTPFDFADATLIDRISRIHGGTAVDVFKPLRTAIFKIFREQTTFPSDPAAWPWLYGDTFGTTDGSDPYNSLTLSGEQLRYLRAWQEGNFVTDWGMIPPPPTSIEQVPVAEQPKVLDRAALDFCAADAFHPGIELTWPMRHIGLYTNPFRIRRATGAEPDYGPHLDVPTVLSNDGPLNGQRPGSLSRWMLVPWQIDTGGCLAGYDERLEFDAPSFWPSRVPNYILPRENYAIAIDASRLREERVDAFHRRRSWFTPLNSPATQWGERLIDQFGRMGVVEAHAGVANDPDLPAVMYVESLPPSHAAVSGVGLGVVLAEAAPAGSSPGDIRARAAGFASEADRIALRRMRFGR